MSMTVAAPAFSEIVVKKSRFIGCVEPVVDREEAVQRIRQLWNQHSGASHVCWALLAGGQSAAVDDGEPGGTAGQPMLNVLRHHDLDGVLATSVRYFGGVKLGAGGLVRAYTDSVAQALVDAEKIVLEPMRTMQCTLPYALEGLVRQALADAGAELRGSAHGEQVEFRFRLAQSAVHTLHGLLRESGQGRITWHDE